MRSRSKALVVLGVAAWSWLGAVPARAERTQSDLVIVRAGDVIREDLYAAGSRVVVEGRVEGDLYAVAFNDVTITGEVTGDVVVAASRLDLSGVVGGSVRAVTPEVNISGSLADDLVVLTWNTSLASGATVGRDVLSWSVGADLAGRVGRRVEGWARNLTIAGAVGETVEVGAGRLRVTDSAAIGGDLIYQSTSPATVAAGTVGGTVVRRTPLPPNVRLRGLALLVSILTALGLGALGLAVAWAWPRRVEAAAAATAEKLRTWASGVTVALSPLVATGVLAALVGLSPPEAGLPLALVLLPLIVGLGGMVLVMALLGVVPVAGRLGRLVVRRGSIAAAVLVGILMLAVLYSLPVVRWVTALALIPLGIGAWVRQLQLGHDLPPEAGE
jgi:hypothetical protein